MSSTLAQRLRSSGRWVLVAWALSLLAPLIVPTQPVVQNDYVVLRVCSLMNGVQFVKIPLTQLTDANIQDQIGQLHASCKCGLNLDHMSFLPADLALSAIQFVPVRWQNSLEEHLRSRFTAHYFARAPPIV